MGRNTPNGSIQAKVNEIMAGAKNHFGDGIFSMSLSTQVTPDPVVPDPSQQHLPLTEPAQGYFTQEQVNAMIERARQQEKDKVYGRLDTLQSQLSEIAKEREERQAAEEEARKRAEEEARRREEAELSAKDLLARKEQEWQSQLSTTQQSFEERLAQMQQEREQERALLEKEREFASLQAYTQQRLAQESDNIAPELADFVTGRTREEIDQSIEAVKAKSAAILEQVQAAQQAARAQQRGTSVSGFAPVGPMDVEAGQRTFSPQDIANMDMAEYAKYRSQFIGQGAASRGLFG